MPSLDRGPERTVTNTPSSSAYVLHKHLKPRPHVDLRLEEDGVLLSWALPRGLPVSPKENRLAIQTGPHDLAQLTYADADKSIIDDGWWEEHDRNDRRIVLTLHGRNSDHRYALIRTPEGWLMHLVVERPGP